MNYPETQIQRAVAVYLTAVLKPPTWWTSIDHGVPMSQKTRARHASIGVRAGIPDILIVHDGRCYWIELKAERGKLSPAQKLVNEALVRAGCAPHLCRSIDDVRFSLNMWRIPTRERPEARAA